MTTEVEAEAGPAAVRFARDLRKACNRAVDGGLLGDSLVQILVEAAAVIIARGFMEDRPEARRLAAEYGVLLRESTSMYLDEIGGTRH